MSGPTQADLKKSRSAFKGHLTRLYADVEITIEERDLSALRKFRDKLKAQYKKFRTSHDAYDATVVVDQEKQDSSQYVKDVSAEYLKHLKLLNKAEDEQAGSSTSTKAESGTDHAAQVIARIGNLPPLHIETFNGNAREYESFITTFKEVVEIATPSPAARLIRLKSHLSGHAQQAIESCRPQDGQAAYDEALKILKEDFGSDYKVCQDVLSNLKNGKMVRNPADIRTFAHDLANAAVTLKNIQMFGELNTQNCIVELCKRLPQRLMFKWRDSVMKVKQQSDRYPQFDAFVKFVREQANVMNDPIYGNEELLASKQPHHKGSSKSVSGLSTEVASDQRPERSRAKTFVCQLCKDNHKLFYCPQFNAKSVDERLAFVEEKSLCKNCLFPGHAASDCRCPYICKIDGCNQKHSKLIHISHASNNNMLVSSNSSTANANTSVTNCLSNNADSVYMPVVPIVVNDAILTYALLDTGSSCSFCTEKLADRLKIPKQKTNYQLRTLHGSSDQSSYYVALSISSSEGTEKVSMNNVLLVEHIPVSSYTVDVNSYPHLEGLSFASPDHVDVIIGQDCSALLTPLEVRRGSRNSPFAIRTVLGWCLNGTAPQTTNAIVTSNFVSTQQIDQKLNRLWEMEEYFTPQSTPDGSAEDDYVLSLWDQECTVVDGHFQIPIPWKNLTEPMPNNLTLAKRRLYQLQGSLRKKGIIDTYNNEINRLVQDGYAEIVPDREINSANTCWYLPHHAVAKKDGKKIRVVFDCASKFNNVSLNTCCLQGPNFTNRLTDVLLKFRTHHYAFMADITAMYNQVKIPPDDRDALRFLWFMDEKLVHMRSTCHIFGGIWSASSALYALRKTAELTDDVAVQDAIKRNFYVDDLAYSTQNIAQAKSMVVQLKNVLLQRGFSLTKYVANDKRILDDIADSERLNLSQPLLPDAKTKALGINWSTQEDQFHIFSSLKPAFTKAGILSNLASIFDPLGLISPLLTKGKVLLQEATRRKLSWEEPLPTDLSDAWSHWTDDLCGLSEISIPRCLIPIEYQDASYELHCFADASQIAYGCCVYLRCLSKSGSIHTALICSKSRICPLKGETVPRLELQAAVLASKLEANVRCALPVCLITSRFWSDSQIVLAYIKNDSKRLKTYVANRIRVIRSTSNPDSWSYVPSATNPADVLTRPLLLKELPNMWFQGPSFLKLHKSHWKLPSSTVIKVSNDDPEVSKPFSVLSTNVQPIELLDRLLSYHSELNHLLRSIAWLTRFKRYMLDKSPQEKSLSADEIKIAELLVIKYVQESSYTDEIKRLKGTQPVKEKSSIARLNPVLNDDGLLVVGGRLKHSALSVTQKHPIILPYSSLLSKLIVRSEHNKCHLGTEWILSHLRRKYWITRARVLIKSVSRDCVICRKLFAKPLDQKMADLPWERTEAHGRAFQRVGADVFGPFLVKSGRHELKRYGCIFVCFSIRAVHIEMLNDLKSDTMINACRRFWARRGTPDMMFTDNATNFCRAAKDFNLGYKALPLNELQHYCNKKGVSWKFNVPCASHMGGMYERLIRTFRKVLAGMMFDKQRITDPILQTLFVEAEAIMNSRPLTKVSSDVNDDVALTPAHFLMIHQGPVIPPGSFLRTDMFRSRWKYIQHLTDLFWKKFLNTYLVELQKRAKWLKTKPNLKVGDLVLLAEEGTPRSVWPLGRVIHVKPGRDGLIRSVRIRTKLNELVRPVTKVIPLEV